MYSDLERTISGGKPSQIRRILETPASEEDTNHDETCNQEPQIAPVRNSEVKDIPPVPWSTSSEFVEEFTFIPAENPKLVRILCHDYEFKKESVMQENQKWRCTTDSCAANLMFIESASAFTDVHLLHNHPPPDLSSLNIENALKVKICPPVASVVKNEDHRIQDGGILDDSPLPLDPSWVWDGPEPLREAVSEGYPPLPPTDQHCPICFMNRSKFDVWKCQACTSTMKSWRNKLRYTVPPILPDCYHSLFQPKFNCNGCRRRRLQWEWTHRQTRPLDHAYATSRSADSSDLRTSQIFFVTGLRGKKLLVYKGYKFRIMAETNGVKKYKCVRSQCRAYVFHDTNSGPETDALAYTERNRHKHPPPDPTWIKRRRVCYQAIRRATQERKDAFPRQVIQEVTQGGSLAGLLSGKRTSLLLDIMNKQSKEPTTHQGLRNKNKYDIRCLVRCINSARRQRGIPVIPKRGNDSSEEDEVNGNDCMDNMAEEIHEDVVGIETLIIETVPAENQEDSSMPDQADQANDADAVQMEIETVGTSSDDQLPLILFIPSLRGRQLLVYNGFKYKFVRKSEQGITYRCMVSKCRSQLLYNEDWGSETDPLAYKGTVRHKHPPPDPTRIKRRRVCYEAIMRATQERKDAPPREIIQEIIQSRNLAGLLSKHDIQCLAKAIYNNRKRQGIPQPPRRYKEDEDDEAFENVAETDTLIVEAVPAESQDPGRPGTCEEEAPQYYQIVVTGDTFTAIPLQHH